MATMAGLAKAAGGAAGAYRIRCACRERRRNSETETRVANRQVLAAIAGRHKGLLALGLRRANRDGLEATGRRVVMHLRRLNRRRGRRRPFVGWLVPKLLQMCCKQWVGGCCAQATELTGARHTAGRGRTRPLYAELTAIGNGGTISRR